MTETKEPYQVTKGSHGGKRVAGEGKSPSEVAKQIVEDIKGTHGGARVAGPGKKIGRPQKGEDKRIPMSFKLPPLLANKLKGEENRTGLIVKLLTEYYGITEL